MRFLVRLVVLGLAAIGAKFLYDTVMSRRSDLLGTADTFRNRTSSAAREMGESVAGAAKRVASSAQTAAQDLRETTSEQADEVQRTAATNAREMQSAAREARDDVVRDLGDAVRTKEMT